MATASLAVDRSEMADTAEPDRLAEILIAQVSQQLSGLLPLPIEEVAKACGILEIRPLETDGFEGGLIQDEFKKYGYILTKAGRHESRTRFTIAHELGHFVNLRHVAPPGQAELLCAKEHLRASGPYSDPRLWIESQANEFAAHVLMPQSTLAPMPFMQGTPEIGRILKLQELCGVSKEAAARRYAELHGADFAVVFSKEGKLLYAIAGGDFPRIEPRRGQSLFRDSLTRTFPGTEQDISEQEESDSAWWLFDSDRPRWELWEEVLIQQNGFRMTLLVGERKSGFDERLREQWTPRFR